MNDMARQQGAALAVGLILLLVLTLLAVAGMNTSSMELVMAGNEQFRQKAFRAAETGAERAIAKLPTVGQSCEPKKILDEQLTKAGNDSYQATAEYLGDGTVPGAVFNSNKFSGLYYEIVSTGRSDRNANSQIAQGAVIPQNSGGVVSVGC